MTKTTSLLKVQVGKETTRGTAVTPTALLMGVTGCSLKPIERVEQIADLRGSFAPAYTSVLVEAGGEGSLEMTATYEDICYLLDGLFSEAAPSGTGPYVRTYNAPLASAASPAARTVVYGDGTDDYKLAGALVSGLTLTIESKAPTRVAANLLGVRVTEGDMAALSNRTVTPILGHHWALYIDNETGTIGSTQISATAFSATLEVVPNRANVHHLSLAPTGWRDTRWTGTLTLNVELTTGAGTDDVQSYLAAILGSSPLRKQIRLRATSGTNELQIDFAGTVLEAPQLFEDTDGVVAIRLVFAGEYNSTLANWLVITSKNNVSALP